MARTEAAALREKVYYGIHKPQVCTHPALECRRILHVPRRLSFVTTYFSPQQMVLPTRNPDLNEYGSVDVMVFARGSPLSLLADYIPIASRGGPGNQILLPEARRRKKRELLMNSS